MTDLPTAQELTDLRLALHANGYHPVPVIGAHIEDKSSGKRPTMQAWETVCLTAEADAITAWSKSQRNNTNTGILGGTIVGVDIDLLDEALSKKLVARALELFGPTSLIRIGRAPKTLLVYRVATPIAKIQTPSLLFGDNPDTKVDTDKCKVEILAKGEHFVAFGIHPDTREPYYWPEKSPLDVPFADVPLVTLEKLQQFVSESEAVLRGAGAQTKAEIKQAKADTKAKTAAEKKAKKADGQTRDQETQGNKAAGVGNKEKPSRAKIADALDHIVNDLSYDDWVNVGFALYDGLGDSGRDLWEKFSAGSSANDPEFTAKKWPSFAKGHSVKVATIFWRAKLNGWWWNNEGDTSNENDVERLNKSHAILPIGGKVRVVTFGELPAFPGRETIIMTQSTGDFQSLQNKYRHRMLDKNGEPISVGLGSHWIKSATRRQYDGGMAFMPQHDGDVGNKLNLWHGFGVKPIKPEPGSRAEKGCRDFLDFMLLIICSGYEDHYEYLLKREATILQKKIRSEIALGLRTKEEGCGKGFYEFTMRRLLGNHAMQITNPEHIVGKFNPHLEVLLRVTADEALFVGDPRHRNALFSLITEPDMPIEPKNCGIYQADNYLNLSITSNADHFVPVSNTARRFFIPTVSIKRMQDTDYFNDLKSDLEAGGYEALLHYLLHEVDLVGFNIRKVPSTAALREQRDQSLAPLETWWVELLENGVLTGSDELYPNKAVSSTYQKEVSVETLRFGEKNTQVRYVTQLGLLDKAKLTEPKLRSTSDHKLGSFLKEMGCDNTRKVLRRRGWSFPPLADCRAAWVKKFPDWKWRNPEITEWQAEESYDREAMAGPRLVVDAAEPTYWSDRAEELQRPA